MSNINNLKMNLQESFDNQDYLKSLNIAETIMSLYDKDDKSYEYLTDLYNLSYLQQKLYKYQLAIKGFKKIIKISDNSNFKPSKNLIRVPSDENNELEINILKLVINSHNSLGICYSKNSAKYNISMAYFEKALFLSTTDLSIKGFEHEQLTSMILYNIGCLHYDLEEYNESIAILERAKNLKILKKEEDLDYIDILNYLSYNFEALDKLMPALGYAETSLYLIKKLAGINSEEYITNLYNLCDLYCKNKQYELAMKSYEKTYNLLVQKSGEDNYYLIDVLIRISECNIQIGKLENYKNAINIHTKILNILKNTLGETHLYYANHLKRIADIYYIIQDYELSLIYYIHESSIIKDLFGLYHKEYIISCLNLINLYILNEKVEEHQTLLNQLFNSIDFDMSKKLYVPMLLSLAKIYVHYNRDEDLNNVYEHYKNITKETFNNMMSEVKKVEDEFLTKNEFLTKDISLENNNLEYIEPQEKENLSNSIRDFFDILRDEVQDINTKDITNLFDNIQNMLLEHTNNFDVEISEENDLTIEDLDEDEPEKL